MTFRRLNFVKEMFLKGEKYLFEAVERKYTDRG